MLERRLFLQIICHIKVLVVSTVLFTSLRLLNFDTQRMYITLQLCTYILLYLLYYIYIINIIYIPFFPQNFQARRFDPTLHRAYSQLSINDSEIKILSLINNAISQNIDQLSVPNVSYKPLTCSVP